MYCYVLIRPSKVLYCNTFNTVRINHRANVVFCLTFAQWKMQANTEPNACPLIYIVFGLDKAKFHPLTISASISMLWFLNKSIRDLACFPGTITLKWNFASCLLWSHDYHCRKQHKSKTDAFCKSQKPKWNIWNPMKCGVFFVVSSLSPRTGLCFNIYKLFCSSFVFLEFCLSVSPLISKPSHAGLKIQVPQIPTLRRCWVTNSCSSETGRRSAAQYSRAEQNHQLTG